MTYMAKVRKGQDPDKLVVADGGELAVESGGELDIESGGAFKIAGTEVTASASELNQLDASLVGATSKIKKISITAPADGNETRTGWSLPANAVVKNVWLNVGTAEATGTTKTINVGTDSTDSGDADGYLTGVSVAGTGLVKGTLLNSGQTLGALLQVDEDGSGAVVPEIDIASGGKEITYTAGSADFAELVADIYIEYIEVV